MAAVMWTHSPRLHSDRVCWGTPLQSRLGSSEFLRARPTVKLLPAYRTQRARPPQCCPGDVRRGAHGRRTHPPSSVSNRRREDQRRLQGCVLGTTDRSPQTAIDVRRQRDVQPAQHRLSVDSARHRAFPPRGILCTGCAFPPFLRFPGVRLQPLGHLSHRGGTDPVDAPGIRT